MISAAALLFRAGAGAVPPVISSVHVPFWALLIAFAAAERFVVHVHFRRSAHSMSLGEIPFVFALVFAGGPTGDPRRRDRAAAVLAVHRKLPVIRLAFNFGVFRWELHRGAHVPRGCGRLDRDLPGRVGGRDPRHRGQLADGSAADQRRRVRFRGPAWPSGGGCARFAPTSPSSSRTRAPGCARRRHLRGLEDRDPDGDPVAGMFISSGRTSPSDSGTSGWTSSTRRRERCPALPRSARRRGAARAGARRVPRRGRGDHLLLARRRRRAAWHRPAIDGAALPFWTRRTGIVERFGLLTERPASAEPSRRPR